MRFEALLLLTIKGIREDISLRLNALTLFIQPVLWLSVFLFLREAHVSMEMKDGTVRYTDFLIIGIFVWRVITFIIGKTSKAVHSSALPSIISAVSGEQIILWSSIISTLTVALLIGASILLTGILIYNFSIYLHEIIWASFVFILIIIIHLGLAIILISFSVKMKDVKSVGFIVTTLFGLFSGIFFPVEFFPYPMNFIAYVLPLTQGLTVIRELTLFANISPNWNLLYALIAEAIVLFVGGLVVYNRNVRNFSIHY